MTWSFSFGVNLGAVIGIAVGAIIAALVYGAYKKSKKGAK
jgi:uncharacterized membrane-anchored protein YhcB (DUF1043 family)